MATPRNIPTQSTEEGYLTAVWNKSVHKQTDKCQPKDIAHLRAKVLPSGHITKLGRAGLLYYEHMAEGGDKPTQ